MAIERPTFHESWHRVADMTPRLRPSVQIHRQHFRGRLWHVVQDPASNQFFRLNDNAYRFVSLLDGRRTVDDAWKICLERDSDEAPTQGEAIQLLGQLYGANLVHANAPGDVEALFRRYQQRRSREIRSYLMNLLFIRIPLIDPERFLDRWVGVVGWLFSWVGFAIWLVLIVLAAGALAGRAGDLLSGASGVLAPANLPLLYIALVFIKLLHELGHGFACKRFGRLEGSGGEVHTIGVMFLVFLPIPYVDASSSWAFRNKWRRVVVGAAGMFVETAVAAIAALVWVNTTEGSLTASLAFNLIFIAGVSTLLFNGNPLLRYDGYYILSDILEIPNLYQRSKDIIYFGVKKWVYGVRNPRNPANSHGEAWLLSIYGVASFIYRVFIYAFIIWFVAGQFFFLGFLLALLAIVTWVIVPTGKLIKFLATSPELNRVRARAVAASGGVVAAILVGLFLIPAPSHIRAEGVVEPVRLTPVYMGADGFLSHITPSGSRIDQPGALLVSAENRELLTRIEQLEARREGLAARRRLLMEEDLAQAQIVADQIRAVEEQIARLNRDVDALRIAAPHAGAWISPDAEWASGAFLKRGARIGILVDPTELLIRAVATQEESATVNRKADRRVEMRVKGRPMDLVRGEIRNILPAGQERLPSAALGYAAGGGVEVDRSDSEGRRAAERFFEVRIAPDSSDSLYPGQRVVVRFDLPDTPYGLQWLHTLRQLLQQRFRI